MDFPTKKLFTFALIKPPSVERKHDLAILDTIARNNLRLLSNRPVNIEREILDD